ncbi:MAG: 50S ribosomal protein L6 [Candidatus Ancillula sp.]|jgi:large subunit ribosomal protein L6|nr:50S ribosomal protein L6 [Candidatus Ancillula sp.]
MAENTKEMKQSRIGKVPVTVPAGVDVNINGSVISVKGPKGELSYTVPEPVKVVQADGVLNVTVPDEDRISRSLHGLARTLIANNIEGVTNGYEKKMEIVGTGYRVAAQGETKLEFALGKSHPDFVEAPAGIKFTVEDNTHFSVIGIDKQQVGEVAANIRKLRAPEPYKGKGIKYIDEHIRRKVGKAGK